MSAYPIDESPAAVLKQCVPSLLAPLTRSTRAGTIRRYLFSATRVIMTPEGYLDCVVNGHVMGWAWDRSNPDARVEVELFIDGKREGSTRAELFREDLRRHPMGDGRHAFDIEIKSFSARPQQVSVRVKGAATELKGSPRTCPPPCALELVAGDVVNNCNLRCPFCMVDYSRIKGLRLMSRETFAKALTLLPHLAAGQFWLSCLHEPTLHPELMGLIRMVPDALRDRVSLTTNLCKRLSDDLLEGLAGSAIDSIRVSYDSRDASVFSALRKGGRLEVFQANLLKLTTYLRRFSPRPRLHFISMAFSDNADDLPELIAEAMDRYGGDRHEVRFAYYCPHMASWGKEHVLGREAWARLEERLRSHPHALKISIGSPRKDAFEAFEQGWGVDSYIAREAPFGRSEARTPSPPVEPEEAGSWMASQALRLRLRHDGEAMIEQIPESRFVVNLNDILDPADYFIRLRRAAAETAA